MPFCYSPWTNIDISPQGDLNPCCKFKTPIDSVKNIKNTSIKEYQESSNLKEIKTQFESGLWPIGCERCKIEEENGIESKRMLDYTRWKSHYDSYNTTSNQFLTASIAFGNTCNLKCITCNPGSSSRWQQEHHDLFGIDIRPNHFYKAGFVEEFIACAPNLIHIDIPGGEPFLSGIKEQKDLLRHWIDSGQAADVSIHYTTNVTVYPDDEWWKIWKHFKNVDIQLSLDGVGSKLEYIRYPAVWSDIYRNIERYIETCNKHNNLQLSVSHTVSAYNVYYLDEFFTWCQHVGLPRPWIGRAHTPTTMRPTVWRPDANQYIIDHLKSSQHIDVQTWALLLANNDDSKYYTEFIRLMHWHDQYRGLNFSNIFPEMAQWIK